MSGRTMKALSVTSLAASALCLAIFPVLQARGVRAAVAPGIEATAALQQRLDRAASGTVVAIGEGTFAGHLRVPEGVTLRGAGASKTIIRAPADASAALVLASGACLQGLRVEGGRVSVSARRATAVSIENVRLATAARFAVRLVDSSATIRNCVVESSKVRIGTAGVFASGGRVRVENCIFRNWDEGLYFDPRNPTRLWVDRCFFENNRDGIDLESTTASISRCNFRDSRDDAIDVDGDSSCTITACAISNCRDDGIEIRLERRTRVLILDTTIAQSGEDAVEVISTPRGLGKGPFANSVAIERCSLSGSKRYGIGLSDHRTEEANPDLSFPVRWRNVSFTANRKGDVAPHRRN